MELYIDSSIYRYLYKTSLADACCQTLCIFFYSQRVDSGLNEGQQPLALTFLLSRSTTASFNYAFSKCYYND